MTARAWFSIGALVLAACQPIHYDFSEPAATPPPASIDGVEVPEPRPAREPFTTTLEVTGASGTVGYLVRFDEVPPNADAPAERPPVGSLLVQDRDFRHVGFITVAGRAYSYRGTEADEIGQGPLELVLPLYFGEKNLSWKPLRGS